MRELRHKVKDFSDKEKFIVLLMDEMKIQEKLVWDKDNGELIGYVDLGNIDLNYATLSKVTTVASHVFVFLIRSIVNPFKFSLANFATDGISAPQMFPLLWKAISICEKSSLKVIAVTCDGASPNRKLFRMCWHLTQDDEMNPETDVTYRTRRFYEDQECGPHIFPKLYIEHIKLTPYSIMNVKLAAQVLSSTVSKFLLKNGPPEAAGIARFCSLMDMFFDIMNIRDINSHKFELKPSLLPFSRVADPRFS